MSTAVLFATTFGVAFAGLRAGAGNSSAAAQQKPDATEVKIDNFSFGPAELKVAGGNDGYLDKSRRYSTHRGQHRQNVQIQSAGYRRKIFVHFQQTRHLRIFLLHSSKDDRQSRSAVRGR